MPSNSPRHFEHIAHDPLNMLRRRLMLRYRSRLGPPIDPAAFITELRALVPEAELPAFDRECENAAQAMQRGRAAISPDLASEHAQLAWSVHMVNQLNEAEPNSITQKPFWGQIKQAQSVQREMAYAAHQLREEGIPSRTRLRLGAPRTDYYYAHGEEVDFINMDLIGTLCFGFKNAQAILSHEIGHSKLTRHYPPRMMEIQETQRAIRHRVKESGGTAQDYAEMSALTVEWNLRERLFDEAENSPVNRYTIARGAKSLLGGHADENIYAVRLNRVETSLTPTGKAPPSNEHDSPEARFHHVMRALRMTFYEGNGLIDRTAADWEKLGVRSDWITSTDAKGNTFQGEAALDGLRQLGGGAQGLEQLVPGWPDRMRGQQWLQHATKDYASQRHAVMEKIWQAYLAPHAEQIIAQAYEQAYQQAQQQQGQAPSQPPARQPQKSPPQDQQDPQEQQDSQEQQQGEPSADGQQQDAQAGEEQGTQESGEPGEQEAANDQPSQEGQPAQGEQQESPDENPAEQPDGKQQDGQPKSGAGEETPNEAPSEQQNGADEKGEQQDGQQPDGQSNDGAGEEPQKDAQPEQGSSGEQGEQKDEQQQEGQSGGGADEEAEPEQEGGGGEQGEQNDEQQQDGQPGGGASEEAQAEQESGGGGQGEPKNEPQQDGQPGGDAGEGSPKNAQPDQEGSGGGQGEPQDGQSQGSQGDSSQEVDTSGNDGSPDEPTPQPRNDGPSTDREATQPPPITPEQAAEDKAAIAVEGTNESLMLPEPVPSTPIEHAERQREEAEADEKQVEDEQTLAEWIADEAEDRELDGDETPAAPTLKRPSSDQSHQSGRTDADSTPHFGNWEDYEECCEVYNSEIQEVEHLLGQILDRSTRHVDRLSRKLDLLPEHGDMDTLDMDANTHLIKRILSRQQVDENDARRFRQGQRHEERSRIELVMLGDGSGSMYSRGVIDAVLHSGCVLNEASKEKPIDFYFGLWGNSKPLLLAKPGDEPEAVAARIMGIGTSQNWGTELAPGLTHMVKKLSKAEHLPNERIGGTHMVMVSDGDLDDPTETKRAIRTMLRDNPHITLDILVVNASKNNQMANTIGSLANEFEDQLGLIHIPHPHQVLPALQELLEQRLERSEVKEAETWAQRSARMEETAKEMRR